jgi:hypothetical protein
MNRVKIGTEKWILPEKWQNSYCALGLIEDECFLPQMIPEVLLQSAIRKLKCLFTRNTRLEWTQATKKS